VLLVHPAPAEVTVLVEQERCQDMRTTEAGTRTSKPVKVVVLLVNQ